MLKIYLFVFECKRTSKGAIENVQTRETCQHPRRKKKKKHNTIRCLKGH
jgi:hypothetical protein